MNKEDALLNQEAQALLRQLGSRNALVSASATQRLLDMGDAGAELLLVFVKGATRQSETRRIWVMVITFFVSFCLSHLFIRSGSPEWMQMVRNGILGGASAFAATRMAVTRQHKRAVLLLASLDDLRAVGPFLELLTHPSKDLQQAASQMLTRLLPRIQADDISLLTTAHWRQIYDILATSPRMLRKNNIDAELVVALLRFVGRAGNAVFIHSVKPLAAGNGLSPEGSMVQTAAQACLPLLLERSQEKNSQTLLRASMPGSDCLLHPASFREEAAPQQLVRASGLADSDQIGHSSHASVKTGQESETGVDSAINLNQA